MASANEQLLAAAEAGDLDAVKRALSEGANIETVNGWNGWTALMYAANNGLDKIVNILLSDGANVNTQANNGWTVLMWAANNGHDQIVNILLSYGADVNTQNNDGNTALMRAAIRGHDQIVNILLSNGANVNAQNNDRNTALMKAAIRGHDQIVNILLSNGANVNTQDKDRNTALMKAAIRGHDQIVNILLSNGANVNTQDKDRKTALMKAVIRGHDQVVNILLDNGANVNTQDKNGNTALILATSNGYDQIVNIILSKGANMNTQNQYGLTALLAAANEGQDQIVNILVSHGANVNTQADNGATALMCATLMGHDQIVNILLSNRVNVNTQDNDGTTALMLATSKGHDQIANILLSNGVNVNTQENDGFTALMYASIYGHHQITNILLSHGVNVNTQNNLHGQTAVMIAAKWGYKEGVELLITHGADISIKDDDGLTALDWARKKEYARLGTDYPAVINMLSTPPAATPDLAGIPSSDMNPSLLAAIKEPVPAAIKEPVPAAIKDPVPAAIKDPVPENPQPVIPPNISSQPASVLEVEEGKDISLTVIAEGSIPLTYQWNRDGEQLQDSIQCDGSSTNCLLVKQANLGVKGQYCCTVSNIKGVVTSSPTSLTIVLLEQQRNLKRLENMMTDKSTIHLKCLKLFLVGPPFVGKTTTLKRLQKHIKNLLSAGVDAKAKSSLLANFSHTFAYVDQDPADYEWLSPSSSEEQIQQVFTYLCTSGQSDFFDEFADNKEKKVNESALDKSPISTPTEDQSHVKTSSAPLSNGKRRPTSPVRKNPFPKVDDIMKEFRATIKAKDYSSFRELFEKSILLSINDVGGQPGFLEMLPALIRGPALYLMFLSLCEALDKPYSVPFSRDGVAITPFDAIHTVESTISQLLSAVSSIQAGSDSMSPLLENASGFKDHFESFLSTRPVTAIIGTHKDQLEGDADAVAKQIQEKQQAMKKIASKHSDIVANASGDCTFFALDNYKGEEEELTPIRKFILDTFKTHFSKATIPIRPAWLLLSLFLCEHYHVISTTECFEIGRRLDMDEEEVKLALQYLHHCIGTVMYLPNIPHDEDNWFRNHIICTPQVVFDSISQIILTSLRILHSSNAAALHCDHADFVEMGLFTMDSIEKYCQSEEISKKLSADELIPAQKLVMFLQYVNLIAPVSPRSVRKECKEAMYFLPALLDGATEEEITRPPQPDANNPAPILITFDFGYVPTGVFCGMITRIVSQGSDGILGMKWELKSEGVKRNMVTFVVDEVNEVTLLAHATCYEIHVKLRAHNSSYSLHDLCCLVLSTVQITLKELFENLEPRISFDCPCEKHQPTPSRDYKAVCTLKGGASSKFVCQYSTVDNKLRQDQVVWISKYAYLGSSECLKVLNFTPADTLKTFSFDWSKEGAHTEFDFHKNVLDIKAVTDNHFSYYKCEVKKAGKLMFTAYRKLLKTDLKFSRDFNCEELVSWLKQKGIPGEDLKVFKDQKINGKSFLLLPRNKKEFNVELECSWTFGGWQTFVELKRECGDEDGMCPSAKRKMSHDPVACKDGSSPPSKRRKMSHDKVACKGIELHPLLLQIKCATSNSEFWQLKLAAQCVGLAPRKLDEVHDISDLYSSLENAFGPDDAISILYLCLKEIKIDSENVRKLPVKEKILENWRQDQDMKFALMVTGICNQIAGEDCKRFIDLWKGDIPETIEDMETLFKHLFQHRVVWSEDVEKLKQVLGCMGNQVCIRMVEKYQRSIKL